MKKTQKKWKISPNSMEVFTEISEHFLEVNPDPTNASPSPPVLAAVECHKVVKDLILRSWSTDHKLRPTIWHFKSQYIKVMGRSQKTVVDGLLDRMQAYSSDLEKAVDERTTQLLFERKKCDDILLERLPRYEGTVPMCNSGLFGCGNRWRSGRSEINM
jgi:hypothetical protein